MAEILPFDSSGSRRVTVSTAAGVLSLTTHYAPLIKSWLLDIENSAGEILITSLNLVTKVDNLLKGKGDLFNGYTLRVYSLDETENNTPDSLGNTCHAVLFGPDDDIPDIYEDAA